MAAVALAGGALLLFFLSFAEEGPTRVSSEASTANASGVTDPRLAAATRDGQRLVGEALQALSAVKATQERAQPAQPQVAPRAREGCSWDPQVRQCSRSLPDMFLFGKLQTTDLMRHQILNERDIPLCPDEIKELERLVGAYNAAVGPLISAYRDVKARERIALIDAGMVEPWMPTANSGTEVAVRAEALRSERNLTESAALVEARKLLGSAEGAPPGNYMLHNGRYYLPASFPRLPVTETYYDNVKFVVSEHASFLMGWFANKGLFANQAVMYDCLRGIATARIK